MDTVSFAPEGDAALVRRCQRDDRHAFNEIVARYKDRVYRYIRGMVRNVEDAEDLAQETFVRAYTAIHSFESRATLHTWLFRIATNLCIDYRRRHASRERGGVQLTAQDDRASPTVPEIADSRHDPAVLLDQNELSSMVYDQILSLPERLRSVILLHDVEGMPYDEIAAVLRCPLGTVKSRLFHARMALRTALLPYLRGDMPPLASKTAAPKQK